MADEPQPDLRRDSSRQSVDGGETCTPPLAAGQAVAAGDVERLLDEARRAIDAVEPPPWIYPFQLVEFRDRDIADSSDAPGEATPVEPDGDTALDVSIEFGRTRIDPDNVSRLKEGSLVALDNPAADPVDVVVNGRVIAKGELCVLDDKFCVRIAELCSIGLLVAAFFWALAVGSTVVRGDDGHGRAGPAPHERGAEASLRAGKLPAKPGTPPSRDGVRQAAFDSAVREDSAPSKSPQAGGRRLPPKSLPRPGAGAPAESQRGGAKPASAASSLLTGLASLAIVVGLFLAVAWAMRRGLVATVGALPAEAVEVLGRAGLAGRQYGHLVRCGNKLLLVFVAPGVVKTLTEITDPAEVDRLTELCRQSRPPRGTAFRDVLRQFKRSRVGGSPEGTTEIKQRG